EDGRQAFADGPGDNRMPGGAYHNQFWFPFPDSHTFLALGVHGQMIYMNPEANVVGVKLSSWALPQDATKLFPTIRAFEALAMAVTSPAVAAPAVAEPSHPGTHAPSWCSARSCEWRCVTVCGRGHCAAVERTSRGRGRGSRAVTHANVCPDRHIRCRTRTQICERRQPAMADSLCRDHVCDRFTAKERDHDT